MLVDKVISGGQTGADQAALVAARALGIDTGGWVPHGWRTEHGTEPWLEKFGCQEHESVQYPPRTILNVSQSDGTVFFGDANSPGGRCTLKACIAHHKPYIIDPTPGALEMWVRAERIKTLNVAGNRESTRPGIGKRVRDILTAALTLDTL